MSSVHYGTLTSGFFFQNKMSEIDFRKKKGGSVFDNVESREDALRKRNRYPHILRAIFSRWETSRNVYLTLFARLKYVKPELFDELKKGNLSSYRLARRYIQQNIQQILRFNVWNQSVYKTINSCDCVVFKVDENLLYIASGDKMISILNRWTRRIVKQLTFESWVTDLQLNDRFLVTKQMNNVVKVFDLKRFNLVQTLIDKTVDNWPFSRLSLGRDLLVVWETAPNLTSFTANIQRLSSSTGIFDPNIEKKIVINTDSVITSGQVYFSNKSLILDVECGNDSRIISVVDMKSLETVEERTFRSSFYKVKRECINDVIIVECDSHQNPFVAWNVVENTMQPIFNLPSLIEESFLFYSFSVTHNPNYQIVLRKTRQGKVVMNVVSAKDWRRSNISFALNIGSKYFNLVAEDFNWYNEMTIYYDGMQLITHRKGVLTFKEFIA